MTVKERILERLGALKDHHIKTAPENWPSEALRRARAVISTYSLAIEIVEAEFAKEGEDEKA